MNINLFDNTIPKKGESFKTLLEQKNIKIIHIVSSNNFDSVEYIQDEDEWVVLLEGQVILLVDGEEKILERGEFLFIPAQISHKILEMKCGTIWLAIHIF